MNRDVSFAFDIRPARAGDEGDIVALLRELAAFEKLEAEFHLDEAAVARDLFGGAAQCDLLLRGEEAVGIAVWFWSYRSFRAARGVYVEDLYVGPPAAAGAAAGCFWRTWRVSRVTPMAIWNGGRWTGTGRRAISMRVWGR